MAFWSQSAKYKALNEKKASKKTKDSLMNAYHVLREKNDQRNKSSNPTIPTENLERGREDGVQDESNVEEVPK